MSEEETLLADYEAARETLTQATGAQEEASAHEQYCQAEVDDAEREHRSAEHALYTANKVLDVASKQFEDLKRMVEAIGHVTYTPAELEAAGQMTFSAVFA